MSKGGPKPYRAQGNYESILSTYTDRVAALRWSTQEGKSPDLRLRFLNCNPVLKLVIGPQQSTGRLGSSHPLRKA